MIQFSVKGVKGMAADPMQALKVFIRFQLKNGVDEQLGLTAEDIEKVVVGIEDDPTFYDKLDDFLIEFIDEFGEDYGIEWSC
jgi:hypothetical protein